LITASYVLDITQPEGMLLIYKHEPEGECLSIDKSHPFKILSSSRFCIPIGCTLPDHSILVWSINNAPNFTCNPNFSHQYTDHIYYQQVLPP